MKDDFYVAKIEFQFSLVIAHELRDDLLLPSFVTLGKCVVMPTDQVVVAGEIPFLFRHWVLPNDCVLDFFSLLKGKVLNPMHRDSILAGSKRKCQLRLSALYRVNFTF